MALAFSLSYYAHMIHRASRQQQAIAWIESTGGLAQTGSFASEAELDTDLFAAWPFELGQFSESYQRHFLYKPDFFLDSERNLTHGLMRLVLKNGSRREIESALLALDGFQLYLDLRGVSGSVLDSVDWPDNVCYLDLQNSAARDYNFLQKMRNLKVLNLKGASIADLNDISGLHHLEYLNAQGLSKEIDVTPLGMLVNLRCLRLGGAGIKNLPSIGGLSRLACLTLEGSIDSTVDVSCLSNLHALKQLSVSLATIEGLASLNRCRQLEDLSIADSYVGEDDLAIALALPTLKCAEISGVANFDGVRVSDVRRERDAAH